MNELPVRIIGHVLYCVQHRRQQLLCFPLLAIADAICSASIRCLRCCRRPADKIAMTDIGRELEYHFGILINFLRRSVYSDSFSRPLPLYVKVALRPINVSVEKVLFRYSQSLD